MAKERMNNNKKTGSIKVRDELKERKVNQLKFWAKEVVKTEVEGSQERKKERGRKFVIQTVVFREQRKFMPKWNEEKRHQLLEEDQLYF